MWTLVAPNDLSLSLLDAYKNNGQIMVIFPTFSKLNWARNAKNFAFPKMF